VWRLASVLTWREELVWMLASVQAWREELVWMLASVQAWRERALLARSLALVLALALGPNLSPSTEALGIRLVYATGTTPRTSCPYTMGWNCSLDSVCTSLQEPREALASLEAQASFLALVLALARTAALARGLFANLAGLMAVHVHLRWPLSSLRNSQTLRHMVLGPPVQQDTHRGNCTRQSTMSPRPNLAWPCSGSGIYMRLGEVCSCSLFSTPTVRCTSRT